MNTSISENSLKIQGIFIEISVILLFWNVTGTTGIPKVTDLSVNIYWLR